MDTLKLRYIDSKPINSVPWTYSHFYFYGSVPDASLSCSTILILPLNAFSHQRLPAFYIYSYLKLLHQGGVNRKNIYTARVKDLERHFMTSRLEWINPFYKSWCSNKHLLKINSIYINPLKSFYQIQKFSIFVNFLF